MTNGKLNTRINQVKQKFGLKTDQEAFDLIYDTLTNPTRTKAHAPGVINYIKEYPKGELWVGVEDNILIKTVIPKGV